MPQRLRRFRGLQLIYTDQCPYIGKAIAELPPVAEKHGVRLKLVELKDPVKAREKMPSPYGVISLVHNGRLLADHAFNPQLGTELMVDDRPVLTDRGFIHVPAADFTPTTEQSGGASGVFWSADGFVYGGSSSFFTEAVAAVFLPQGVTVNLVAVTAVDDSTHHLALSLRRRDAQPDTGTDLMAYIETDSDNAGVGIWLDDTINQPVIDNAGYLYYLFAENLTTEKKLRSVFIHYEY